MDVMSCSVGELAFEQMLNTSEANTIKKVSLPQTCHSKSIVMFSGRHFQTKMGNFGV